MFFFRKGLIKHLVEKGYDVHVIAPEDYKTEDLKKLGCVFHPLNFQTKNTNPLADFFLLLKLRKLYKSIQPNIIFQYTIKPNIYGTIAARLAGVKSIAIVTGLGYAFLTDNWINKLVQKMYRFAFRFSFKVWFLNQDDQDLFIKRKIVKTEKAFLLPGEGVNTSEFIPAIEKPDEKSFIFLMLARVLWDKGVKEYVEAAQIIKKEFPKAQFQLLGATDVDNPSSVPKSLVEEWHKKEYIHYLGLSIDVRNEIAKAHCIVLPSYREGISKVLMEAAAMAKPLIATNVTGCKELIEEGLNGYLCEAKDIGSLADQMRKMIALSDSALQEMGNAGRKKMIEGFDEQRVIQYYLQFI